MLYSLIISPIETIIDWVFNFMTIKFASFGIIGAVVGVSLAINFLALPLYSIADSLQEKERKIAKALEPRIKRIKKAFKGNEQFMMLSTYYRQNNYHPLYALRSSLSILIEIPFFIAAYHYLSNCEALSNSSFWIFNDLGAPDGLFRIGKFSINVLPVIMTAINFISSLVYLKNCPVREKVQLYAIAAVFLILLYNSPSGLVIYWILNNLFSLAKNIVMKMKHPGRVLHIVLSCIFLAASVYFFTRNSKLLNQTIFLIFALAVTFFPLIKKLNCLKFAPNLKIDFSILIFSGIGLSFLCGFLIPASVISTSPIEFSFLGKTESPLAYIYNSILIFIGFFVVWPIIIFELFKNKISTVESLSLFVIFILAILNTFVFKADYGNLNTFLEVNNLYNLTLGKKIYLLSLFAAFFVLVVTIFIRKSIKTSKILSYFLISVCVAEFGVSLIKTNSIKKAYNLIAQNKNLNTKNTNILKEYNFSKEYKNVIVLFLDRAINTFVPEIFREFPEIEKQFQGFTYYPNSLSFSDSTIQGVPAMMGGYEYTQEEINARKNELLRNKHNEAILVMPKLFLDAGFETTVTDVPWPNYRWQGDLEFFKKYPQIQVKEIEGKYYSNFAIEKLYSEDSNNVDQKCRSSFIDFATLQCLPPFLRGAFYNTARRTISYSTKGNSFFFQLSNLYYLPQMTDFSAQTDTFTFIENEATHEVIVSLADDFETLAKKQSEEVTLNHYQANVATLKQIGKWLDFLRVNNVFDNSRIIIVSDHGRGIDVPSHNQNIACFSALLMVKEFNSNKPVTTNYDFMTNADTLFLAKEGLDISNINPFTGKLLTQNKNHGVNIYHTIDWNAEHFRNEKELELDKNRAFHVSGNIFDEKNWIPLLEWENRQSHNGGAH